MGGQPLAGGMGLATATFAQRSLLVIAGGFYRNRFGVPQQDQFVHGETPGW
jgi:hypothetical protein